MKTYYQVCAVFSLSGGTPQLVSMSLNSTIKFFPFLVYPAGSVSSISRFFRSLPQAQEYVSFLYSRYPTSAAALPVLDSGQLSLF